MSRNACPTSNVPLYFTGEPRTVKPQGQITLSILYGRVTNKIHETNTLHFGLLTSSREHCHPTHRGGEGGEGVLPYFLYRDVPPVRVSFLGSSV